MKDLKVYFYFNKTEHTRSYDTLMHFTDYYEQNKQDRIMKTGHTITAVFFEKDHLVKHFENFEALYEHCRIIML